VRYAVFALAAWFLAAFQLSVMPYVKVLGLTPDLVLIFAACFAVLRARDEAMIVLPVTGLIRDLIAGDPVGASIIGFAPLLVLSAYISFDAVETKLPAALAVVLLGTVAYGVLHMTVLSLTGESFPLDHALLRVVAPLAAINGLFMPLIYMPLSWASPAPRPVLKGGRLGSAL
jgi:rod shape-determining protein MreD